MLPLFLEKRELPSRQPLEIRRALLEDLRETVRAQAGLFCKMGRREGESCLRGAAVLVTGAPQVVDRFRHIEGLSLVDGGVTIESQAEFGRLTPQWRADMSPQIREHFWDPVGVNSSLGMHVAREGRHIGFFGVLRTAPHPEFAKDAGAALGSRAEAYGDILEAAEALETSVRGRALFVISNFSEVSFASDEGRELLGHETFKDALLSDVRRLGESASGGPQGAWSAGAFLRIHPVAGESGTAHVAILDPMQPAPVRSIHLLSATKRKIAALASSGATVAEIARTMGRSPETVRSHLSDIYARLGIGSRAELAVIVREAWW